MDKLDKRDFISRFTLTAPVVVLGEVVPGKRSQVALPPPIAYRRESNWGTPFNYEEYAIHVEGFAVGLVFFPVGEGSERLALERWLAWKQPTVIDV